MTIIGAFGSSLPEIYIYIYTYIDNDFLLSWLYTWLSK